MPESAIFFDLLYFNNTHLSKNQTFSSGFFSCSIQRRFFGAFSFQRWSNIRFPLIPRITVRAIPYECNFVSVTAATSKWGFEFRTGDICSHVQTLFSERINTTKVTVHTTLKCNVDMRDTYIIHTTILCMYKKRLRIYSRTPRLCRVFFPERYNTVSSARFLFNLGWICVSHWFHG